MQFNEKLMSLRKQKGMSQEQLGEGIGVTRQTISKWELGETTPDMDKLILLADLFEISIDRLVGKSDDHSQDDTSCIMQSHGHYEYKSKKCIHGIPIVHINIGSTGSHKAKGIIAIGNISQGLISIGILSIGLISVGVMSLGMVSLGAITVGLLLALGGTAIGIMAFGGIAIGVFAMGGLAIGAYSVGGCAIAGKIAMGGYAYGTIAIGDKTKGEIVFDIHTPGQEAAIKAAILSKFPHTIKAIVKIFSSFF